MAISFNTGATADSASGSGITQNITVPPGVLANDVVLVLCEHVIVTGTTPATLSISSTGTTPLLAPGTDNPVTGSETLPAAVTGQLWYFVASATDAGKVITVTASSAGFRTIALAAYTGASTTSPIDVLQGAFGGAGVASVTCPVVTTVSSGDWAVFLGGGAAEGANITIPAGSTSRESDVSSADIAAAISDSAASAGAGGTSIGGGTFTTASAANSILTAFTLGLAPPGTGAVSGTVQPKTVTFRRVPDRAFWRGRGAPFIIPVPAVSGFASRRRSIRGQHQSVSGVLAALPVTGGLVKRRPFIPGVPCWRGVTPVTANALPVPGTVAPLIVVIPRRHIRAYWRGVTPITSNALPTGALTITLAQARLLWDTGPAGLTWTAVEARALWMSGPVGVS